MEKNKLVKKQQDALINYLNQHTGLRKATKTSIQTVLIADEEKGHFQLVSFGQYEERYVYYVQLHFLLESNGTVHILFNETDEPIMQHLMEIGFSREQIILESQKRLFENDLVTALL